MNIITIRNLKDSRKKQVDSLEAQIEALKNNDNYSDQYKNEHIKQLQEDIQAVKEEYEPKIDEMIEDYEQGKKVELNKAEYTGLSDREVNIQLLQEMRNQSLTDVLISQNQSNSNAREDLMDGLSEAVDTNDVRALAYLQALKQLNIHAVGLRALESQYKQQNMNDEQKAIQSDLDAIEELKAEYTTDVKGDPFQNRLAKYQ